MVSKLNLVYLVYVQALFQTANPRWKVYATDSKSGGYLADADASLAQIGFGQEWDASIVVHELNAREAVQQPWLKSNIYICSWPVPTNEVLADACAARKEMYGAYPEHIITLGEVFEGGSAGTDITHSFLEANYEVRFMAECVQFQHMSDMMVLWELKE